MLASFDHLWPPFQIEILMISMCLSFMNTNKSNPNVIDVPSTCVANFEICKLGKYLICAHTYLVIKFFTYLTNICINVKVVMGGFYLLVTPLRCTCTICKSEIC